jgi:hypothetical protein
MASMLALRLMSIASLYTDRSFRPSPLIDNADQSRVQDLLTAKIAKASQGRGESRHNSSRTLRVLRDVCG